MTNLVDKLICDNVKALTPYESARRLFSQGDGKQQQVWLNANESPFTGQYDLDCERLNRYPDCQPASVVGAYARYAEIEPSNVLVTRGADEGIELLIRTFCQPKVDSILICPPTYGMYAISAQTCDVGVQKAPLNNDFSLDLDAIKAFKDQVKLVFICSPNNPTGTRVAAQDIKAVVEHFADSALVVVDEAYIEFDWQSNWANQLGQYSNLVILRTLSKAFALAGLRCGFTLANKPVIDALLKVIAPYPIPEPVAQIAAQALSPDGQKRMQSQLDEIIEQRDRVKQYLDNLPQVELVGDQKANFILFRCEQKDQLMAHLVANNLFIRDQSKQVNLQNCLRITLGDTLQNSRFMALVNEFFKIQEQVE
jgi:histidinol-phosphate aminotransferase